MQGVSLHSAPGLDETSEEEKMKKIIAITTIVSMLLALTACGNYRFVDSHWEFNYAYITFPDGTVKEVEVVRWAEDSQSVTIEASDGQVYSVSYYHVIMTKERVEE